MTGSARELIDAVQAELAPRDDENRLVPLIEKGKAAREVFAAVAAEEYRIVRSDWRSFLTLASRSQERGAREFFDFFGTPSPELEEQAVAAVQAAMDAGRLSEKDARTHARLFQSYELDFWNTLADEFRK
jgi:hypothetical protein